jgi:hypothetical protein
MRASGITALAALGLAGVLLAPMTANATSIGSTGPARAVPGRHTDGSGQVRGGSDDDGWKFVKEFESRSKCLAEADKYEDKYDVDTLCVPEEKKWDLWIHENKSQR